MGKTKYYESDSIALDLEHLSSQYKTLLIRYNQAVLNYITYLKEESVNPCHIYTNSSKGINQPCYDYIWKKAGCTQKNVGNSTGAWAKVQTLNGLIADTFSWSTLTDTKHRMACYGNTNKPNTYNKNTSPDYNINKEPLMAVKGSAYWGTSAKSQQSSSKLQDCQASCAKTVGCSGATFNSSTNTCMLRGGNSNIIRSSQSMYAIVPKGKQLLKIIKDIDQQLTNINTQIQSKTDAGEPIYTSNKKNSGIQNTQLQKQYQGLINERHNISNMLNEYESLDHKYNEGTININQNYYSFILLLAIVLIIIFIMYKYLWVSVSSSQISVPSPLQPGVLGWSTYYIIFGIILCILAIHFYNKYY